MKGSGCIGPFPGGAVAAVGARAAAGAWPGSGSSGVLGSGGGRVGERDRDGAMIGNVALHVTL
ncbi:hypothetical protein GCM10009727_64660 [Actinomadura napierensis]|uniref:Uncharacterized protein n=1 Tax=Actinomadura napierensis TaxID=267854 RepID=A0ABP5LYS4_9ACTN